MKKQNLILLLAAVVITLTACSKESVKRGIEVSTCQYAEKDGQQLKMDIYSQGGSQQPSARRPVIIFSFGGGWENGTRHDGRKLLEDFARHGYVAVGIDYRLGIRQLKEAGTVIDSASFASSYQHAITLGVEDLYDATRYVIDHAQELGADTSRIVISGSSAGATNCLTAEYMLCNGHELASTRLPASFNYAAVVPLAGGVWLADTDTLVWQRKPCPVLAYHGTDDQLVPFGRVVLGGRSFGGFGPDYYMPQLKRMEVSYLFHQYQRGDHLIAGIGDNELVRSEIMDGLERLLDSTQHVALTISEEYYGLAPNIAEWLKAAAQQQ